MRTRSEEKRRQIVRVAAKAFEELGYERTSMLTIAERFSGSKQTLYNFPLQEDLLRRCRFEWRDRGPGAREFEAERICARRSSDSDAYLNGQLAPSRSRHPNRRESAGESKLGEDHFENVLRPAWSGFRTLSIPEGEGKLRSRIRGAQRCTGGPRPARHLR